MSEAAVVIPIIVVAVVIIVLIIKSIYVVKQKEVIIIERFGHFKEQLVAGVHFIVPFVDRPKRFSYRYYVSDPLGRTHEEKKINQIRVSTQTELIDFPAQVVISRDNAALKLDAVLSYKIKFPKLCMYTVQNLPLVLSKILQAQLRTVAGSLDVDQIIEDAASLHVLTGQLAEEARRWGVEIQFVKVQKVEAGPLAEVLAKKKGADLENKQVIIGAKATKQTQIIESEGQRDSMIKEAEGQQQEVLSRARGDAQAMLNFANAEARSIKEIARAIQKDGSDPSRYLLATKYIEALAEIVKKDNTEVLLLPHESAFIQTMQELGLSTVALPHKS